MSWLSKLFKRKKTHDTTTVGHFTVAKSGVPSPTRNTTNAVARPPKVYYSDEAKEAMLQRKANSKVEQPEEPKPVSPEEAVNRKYNEEIQGWLKDIRSKAAVNHRTRQPVLTNNCANLTAVPTKLLGEDKDDTPLLYDSREKPPIVQNITYRKIGTVTVGQRAGIEESIRRHRVEELIHFTALANLSSIVEHGIYTRKYFNRLDQEPAINDPERYDGFLDATSLSVSFPNSKLLYTFQCMYKRPYVVIALDPKILLDKKCLFFKKNAARSDRNSCGFEEMFDGQEGPNPRDVQAEILVFARIEPRYIKRIYVKDEESFKIARRMFPNVRVNGDYFYQRD